VAERPSSPAGLRTRLATGPAVVSTFVKLDALEVVDLLAATGLDAIVVDLEHSQLDEAAARRLVRHATALGLPALVRVPEVDRGAINRILEAGAVGIQLSTLTGVEQARALRSACLYAPEGRRSVSLAQPGAGYGARPLAELIAPDARPLLVGQIETATTTAPLAELVALLDVAFVGVTDLSVDLGEGGDLSGPLLADRVAAIADAATQASVAFGGWIPSPDRSSLLGSTARYVTVGSDLGVLRAAIKNNFDHPQLEE
jgi:4-hydroxy-2-oxoheptanedioate aldolase